MGPSGSRSGVLHYVDRWLEPSAQFVHSQIARSRYPGVVVTNSLEGPERFPYERVVRLRGVGALPGAVREIGRTAALAAVAVRYGVRLVHVHFGYRLPDVSGMVKVLRRPCVVSLHGHDATAFARTMPGHFDLLPSLDAVVVPSRYFAGVATQLGARPEAVRVIPAGVDTAFFLATPVPDRPEVLFVGRFVEKKGLDVLLEAWPHVRDAIPGATLRLLGYGPLEALARSAGSNVEVVIAPDRATVRDAIAAARVVTTPSHTSVDGDVESLLLVNLEAQASGRPVVSTRHGGIPEYVMDGETGTLVAEGDPSELGRALIEILRNDELARRLGSNGERWAARFDATVCAARVDDLYSELSGGFEPAKGAMRSNLDTTRPSTTSDAPRSATPKAREVEET